VSDGAGQTRSRPAPGRVSQGREGERFAPLSACLTGDEGRLPYRPGAATRNERGRRQGCDPSPAAAFPRCAGSGGLDAELYRVAAFQIPGWSICLVAEHSRQKAIESRSAAEPLHIRSTALGEVKQPSFERGSKFLGSLVGLAPVLSSTRESICARVAGDSLARSIWRRVTRPRARPSATACFRMPASVLPATIRSAIVLRGVVARTPRMSWKSVGSRFALWRPGFLELSSCVGTLSGLSCEAWMD